MVDLNKYFLIDFKVNKLSLLIKDRLKRKNVLNLINILHITSGDIIALVFWKEAIIYRFEGICFSIKNKSLTNFNTSISVRNVILGVGVEVIASYFPNRVYFMTILDYKRKQFLYRKSKLYYLRKKLNRSSKVK